MRDKAALVCHVLPVLASSRKCNNAEERGSQST
jgi:hypothetical protein